MSKLKEFLARKDIVISPQRYLIDALGAMAQGLFASLLIGTIIKTVGQQTGLALLVDLGGYATAMSGPAMACAIGWALHCPPLVLFSLITVGYSANALGGAGGPLAVLIIAIVAAELGKAVSKETKVDILVTPLVTIFAGVGLSMLIAAPIGAAASQVGTLIMWATEQAPLVMGILVSVIVGVALTLPISSAAICAALGLTGLAGGAAVAGCCAQMVGFAVMSYKENGVGGLVSQGLGTSMLQMGNIIKNPRIWIAPTLASAITGPLATCLFHFEMNGAAVSSGRHLRSGGSDRRLHRLGQRHCRRYQGRYHPHGLGCYGAAVLCAARRAQRGVLRSRAQAGLDQRGRFEAELNSYSKTTGASADAPVVLFVGGRTLSVSHTLDSSPDGGAFCTPSVAARQLPQGDAFQRCRKVSRHH